MALVLQSEPSLISWSRHPLNFICRSDAVGKVQIRQELYRSLDDSLVHKTANLPIDDNGDVSFDWSKIITDEISGEIPQLVKTGFQHQKSTFFYHVKCIEIVDGVEGMNVLSQDRFAVFGSHEFFLTQYQYVPIDMGKDYLFQTSKPLERELFSDQEEVISVLFTRVIAAPRLDVKLIYTDNTDLVLSEVLPATSIAEIRTFDLSFETWGFSTQDSAKIISRIEVSFYQLAGDTLIYKVDHNGTKWLNNFLYANGRGGFDVLAATGEQVRSEENKGETYLDNKNALQVRQDHRLDRFVQNSGYKPRTEISAYKQLREINRVFQIVKDQQLASLTLLPTTTEIDRDGSNLNGFSFEYMFGDGRQDFDTINATAFVVEGGEMSLPIEMNDVIGLLQALAGKVEEAPAGDIEWVRKNGAWERRISAINLGVNGTALNAQNSVKLFANGVYNQNTLLNFSNTNHLKELALGITNTNANVITFNGLTLSFKESELPEGVSFANNALTFPADNAVLYNVSAVKFHDNGIFSAKVELTDET